MRVVIAPDKFKGTLSAAEVAEAMAAGVEGGALEADLCPVADGGDGTAAVLLEALGGEWHLASAQDPIGRPIEALYATLADGRTAVVEVASASGLARVDSSHLDPLAASSEGTGDLIAAAVAAGAEEVIVACGGSASTDGGLGALSRFDPASVRITCLCDVSDPFMGALRYAPQKGAEPEQLAKLEQRLGRIRAELPHDPGELPFTGAAGGLAGGLWAHGARLVGGARYLLEATRFDARLAAARLVFTGEGCLDETSLAGKAVGEIARRARGAGVPCLAIVGADRLRAGRDRFAAIAEAGDLDAIGEAAARLARVPEPEA